MKFIQYLTFLVTLISFQINYVICETVTVTENLTLTSIITTTKENRSTTLITSNSSFGTKGTIPTTTSNFPDLSDKNKNTTAIVVLSLFAIVGIAVVSIFLACQYFKSKKASERYNTLNMDGLNQSTQARGSGGNSVQMRSRGDDFQIEFTNPAFHFEQDEIQGPPNHNRLSRARADSFDD
jgi:hypothetical protein